MGKKLVKSEKDIREHMTLPRGNDVLGIVTRILGQRRVRVICQDGNKRLCRIRGKMRRRHWVRKGDAVLVSPWGFNSDQKGDILFRYTRNQAHWLRNRGMLTVEDLGMNMKR
ncbi:MAG: translation initiation factor eIF-1A [Candidatus Bathyarchaeota archaeon]|jgi:translation initiation factor 1A